MFQLLSDTNIKGSIHQSSNVLKQITDSFFNARSITVLILSLAAAILLGRLIAALLRRATIIVDKQTDRSQNLNIVNRLRRFETLIVLSIALIRSFLVIFALYFWWSYTHPDHQPSAIIGASAIGVIVLGGVLAPILRDLAYGSVMMAEHWYGVGDHIRIEPFADLQGVVERVTLRSTRVRGLSGEVIWVNNQNIQGVRVTPKGIRTIAIELFVNDPVEGEKLIEQANQRLPIGPLMVVSPLAIMTKTHVGNNLWHLTAIAETSPGREWFIDKFAIDVIQEIAAENGTVVHDPVARYADSEAEKRFARALKNAGKTPTKSRYSRRHRHSKKD